MKGAFSDAKGQSAKVDTAPGLIRKAPADLFRNSLASIVDAGAAVMLSATRDGSALVVTLLNGSERAKAYATSAEELSTLLADAVASVTSR